MEERASNTEVWVMPICVRVTEKNVHTPLVLVHV